MSNGSEVMIYLSFLLSEFIATRRARLEAREAGFLVYINIIDYPLCTVEKKWSNKLKQIVWTTSKFGWTTFVPVSFQFLPVHFQSTSSLLPVYFQFSSRLQSTSKSTFLCQIFDFLWNYYKLIGYTVWTNNDIIDNPLCNVEKTTKNYQTLKFTSHCPCQ